LDEARNFSVIILALPQAEKDLIFAEIAIAPKFKNLNFPLL
jgi:hypothetical protein